MNFDLWHWSEVLNKEEIKKVVNICESNESPLGDKRGLPLDGEEPITKTAKVTCTRWEYLSEILDGVCENWLSCNQFEFGYNLFPMQKNELLNYNVYDSSNSGEYDFHIDCSPTNIYDIKLTAMINLSEEYYEGGDLIIFTAGKEKKISEFSSAGSSIMFKSWIPHKVTPVTKGIRKTISIFLAGPKFT